MNRSQAIAHWKARNEEHRARFDKALEGIEPGRFNRSPDPNTWSPGQVTEHMTIVNGPYIAAIDIRLLNAPGDSGDPPVRYTFVGKLLIRASGPDANTPAPAFVTPRSSEIGLDMMDRWRSQQTALHDLIDRAESFDINRIRIKNPFVKLIRLSLADCFEELTVHNERHIRQIEQRV